MQQLPKCGHSCLFDLHIKLGKIIFYVGIITFITFDTVVELMFLSESMTS